MQTLELTVTDLLVVALDGSGDAASVLRESGADGREVHSLDDAVEFAGQSAIDVLLVPYDGTEESLEHLRSAAGAVDAGVLAILPEDLEGNAVREALDAGALDFVHWPGSEDQLRATALLVAHNRRLLREVRQLRSRPQAAAAAVSEWIGCSPAIRRLQGVLSRAAESDVPVLVEGAAGTGKTLCARSVHYKGRRSPFPLLECDAASLDVAGLEAALREADRGTLLLEDIDKLPGDCQARLVRFLKERSSGTTRGARLVATTAARLAELTARGAFREDLYYRLNVFPITLPSLQERREDVSMLADQFLQQSADSTGLPNQGFSPAAMILLESHPWEGNVAQLRNAIFRAHALAAGGKIDRVHLLSPAIGVSPASGMGVPPEDQIAEGAHRAASGRGGEYDDDDEVSEADIRPFQEEEQRLLSRALRATRGNVRRAAQLLGIGRATLYRKIQIYNLRMQ